MGCDLSPLALKIEKDLFQSTHPHGVRHNVLEQSDWTSKFQSTHPHGVRLPSFVSTDTSRLFQSTHPHGVRRHIQQKAEYHIAKVYNLRRKTKRIILKEIKAKK